MHNGEFQLDPQLAKDCFEVCDLPLSKVLLMNDSQYPWLIQVPRINHVTEIIDLTDTQQSQLWYESSAISRAVKTLFEPDKLNIAALGNVVAQLHIHHIARYHHDVAWPNPVWGAFNAIAYENKKREGIIFEIKTLLEEAIC